ncbi:MAG: hypothetical protein D3908_07760, partial [Candidatus Electrothrix sp. AUS4]|nr:hypothetical protein [Candidatus Electrothrix sp. AUS4]
IVYHDGDPIPSTLDKDKHVVTAQISHFSEISINVYFEKYCKQQPAIVDSDGKDIAGLTHILCPDL